MNKNKQRADFMSKQQQESMKGFKRTHQDCLARTGVMRPGKTAKDRAKRIATEV